MKHRLLIFCSLLSLLLCVAVCVLWLRSYVVSDALLRNRPGTAANGRFAQQTWFVQTGSGGIACGWTENAHPFRGGESVAWPTVVVDPVYSGFSSSAELPRRPIAPATLKGLRVGPFQWVHDRVTWGPLRQQQATTAVVFPFWLPALLLALASAASLRVVRRIDRRARIHLCPRCDYDLRESPERCPECGTVVKAGS